MSPVTLQSKECTHSVGRKVELVEVHCTCTHSVGRKVELVEVHCTCTHGTWNVILRCYPNVSAILQRHTKYNNVHVHLRNEITAK